MKQSQVLIYSHTCQQVHHHSKEDTSNSSSHSSLAKDVFEERCRQYQANIANSIEPLISLKTHLRIIEKQIKQQLSQLAKTTKEQIKKARLDYDEYFYTSDQESLLKQGLTCQQKAQLVAKIDPLQQQKFIDQRLQQRSARAQTIYTQVSHLLQQHSVMAVPVNKSCHPFSSQESSIRSALESNTDSSFNLEIPVKNEEKEESKSKRFKKKNELSIAQSRNLLDSHSSLYEADYQQDTHIYAKIESDGHSSRSKNTEQEQWQQNLSCLHKNKRSKAYIQSDDGAIDSEESSDQEQKVNESVIETQKVVNQASFVPLSQSSGTLAQLKKASKGVDPSAYRFDVKVRVLKVLYFSVVFNPVCLKMKFIASDSTGLAVFWTNYHKMIQPGVCLEMFRCKFGRYKGSLEILNRNNFRRIEKVKELGEGISGVRLNREINSIDGCWYYDIPDERCALISQVIDKLAIKQAFRLYRMVVKITKIIKTLPNTTYFCQIADSSGRTYAYLGGAASVSGAIETGQVYMLKKIKAFRGKPRHECKYGSIFYIDACCSRTKVEKFRHGFVQVSERKFKYPTKDPQ